MKKILLACALPLMLISQSSQSIAQSRDPRVTVRQQNTPIKIQVALLLDTSSSMDGLINQAKSRLWNIVNTLSTLRYQGHEPILEIALYEYGNNNLSAKQDYIRQVTGFTSDLDLISELLFALTTNGGYEYCGSVIQKSISELNWSSNDRSLKLMYIAGNESFDQGEINYKKAITAAVQHNISLHTIYCGDKQSGINEYWKKAAEIAGGKYFNIDMNRTIQYKKTPYDDRITALNQELNQTYVGYGYKGKELKLKQAEQDANASNMSPSVMTERTLTKSSSKYSNASWDVVDAYTQDKEFIKNTNDKDWPEEMRHLTPQQREKKILELKEKRASIQKEIHALAMEREKYLSSQTTEEVKDDLGYAITQSILELAKRNKYTQ